ncbi:SDR family NAD(P)-dependent oxidoreductase [Thermoanaerobacterium saccharolyticum]|uniref:SDR family NAD(P)-dependent oxidoreductase n=1 Tax=Thermoanaerobacterium saccharolyticum TaxID=28896 RepID=UPI002FDA57BC
MTFQDKVVLITGAAGGIGKETAKSFAAEGAKLALVDLNMDALEKAAQDLNLQKENYLLICADVSKEEQVQQYVKKAKDHFGKIDVFFNNAGVEGKVAPITDYPSDSLDLIIDVNIKGVFYGLKYVLRVMKEQGFGSIINTSSIAGLKGMPNTSAYNASKAAVIALTKTAAVEYAGLGIRVNAVCPALVNTRMMRSLEKEFNPEDSQAAKEFLTKSVPLGRYSEPKDVSEAVLFLASEKASFITGIALEVVGGMTA